MITELKVMPVTHDQPYTSRLSQLTLNNLNLSYITGLEVDKNYIVKDGSIKNGSGISFKEISKGGEDPTFVCQAVCDVKKYAKYVGTAFINNVIQGLGQANASINEQQKKTWLIPLMQARFWKKHCVLVEVTIEKGEKKINIHDSQSWWRNLFYPNCLKDLKRQGYRVKYIHHAKQSDNYSCVYFVYHYIKEILTNPISARLESIHVSLSELKGKNPIEKLIGNNFRKKYPEINVETIQSNDVFPWEKKTLKDQLSKDDYKQSGNLIPSSGEGSLEGSLELEDDGFVILSNCNFPQSIPDKFEKELNSQLCPDDKENSTIEQKMTYRR
ncbi:MAG: hypothetical protein WA659_01850 [Candidatus Aquirickettsiella sp.]